MKILIVEDENISAMELEHYITSLGYHSAGIASNAKSAQDLVKKEKPDLVLMDICIKGENDGIETASMITESNPLIKIIFLTAYTDNYNIDRAVKIDPVAYLSKPYNRQELIASIKIAQYKINNKHVIYSPVDITLLKLDEEFSYDEEHNTLYYFDTIVNLTKKETDLLSLFIHHKNKIVDHYTIENTLWPTKEANSNTIRTLVRRLRPKLKYRFIKTIPSQGYTLNM
ncbi:MAG: response regulator [Campylobacterales bacterium]|nr:response regulator [Campylobacterales bacterium]